MKESNLESCKIKNAIEISNKLSDYIVTMAEEENEVDENEMYDTFFTTIFDILKHYDSKTLNNLNKNLV